MRRFPRGMRPSTLDERRRFYSEEFDTAELKRWIGERKSHLKFAMIMGRHTGIALQIKTAGKDDVVIIDSWKDAEDLRGYALRYLPESVYYDRNRYDDVSACHGCGRGSEGCSKCYNYSGQQLAFDLDPENVDCPYHGHIGERMARGRGLSFCMYEFKEVRKQAAKLSEELSARFSMVSVVYSGRGFHVVVDDERGYALARKDRVRLARSFGSRYAIDEWVTSGSSRLMRLPYSLNGLVSRKCMIMKDGERDLLEFDPRTSSEVIPRFMASA